MPIYLWKCKHEKCKLAMEIIRSFDDYQDIPNKDDDNLMIKGEPYKECTEEEGHEWQKELDNFLLVKPTGWGQKGSWIQILMGGVGIWMMESLTYLDMLL